MYVYIQAGENALPDFRVVTAVRRDCVSLYSDSYMCVRETCLDSELDACRNYTLSLIHI